MSIVRFTLDIMRPVPFSPVDLQVSTVRDGARMQLWLGDTTLPALIDRIAGHACAVDPALDFLRVREVADRLLRASVHQTVSCSRHGVCAEVGPAKWGGHGRLPIAIGSTKPCQVPDEEADKLPAAFALAAATLALPLAGPERDALEDRLATVFRQGLLPYLFENKHCEHAPICLTARSDPFG
jgi:hypothetical protein